MANQAEKTTTNESAPGSQLARGTATRLGMLGMLATGAALGAACSNGGGVVLAPGPASAQTAVSDIDILNFALNLEYLESEFYYYATTGQGIAAAGIGTSGTGTAGATTGGVKTTFTNSITQAVALQITSDEGTHVTLLRSALGNQAIAKPAIDLTAGGKYNFSSMNVFLALSRAFEDTGVSAYSGAAPLISSKEILQTAAQILTMETYHASNVRLQIAQMGIPTTPTDSQDVVPPPSGTDYFCDHGALGVVRSTAQVIAIVKPFFPNGLNGAIH
jgi:hypothetical protein